MAQFDVFENPIVAARAAYPYVVTLQADIAQTSQRQIVAPLVPADSILKTAGRLTPVVALHGARHAVLVPSLSSIRSRDLRVRYCTVASARGELLAAVDYMFFGI